MSTHSKDVAAQSGAILSQLRQTGPNCDRLGPGVSRNDVEDSVESLLATHGNGNRALYFPGHCDVMLGR
jgi:hypothetical protein